MLTIGFHWNQSGQLTIIMVNGKFLMASIHLYFARKQVGDTPKRGKPNMRSSCRNSLDLHWSPWPWPGRGSASVPHLRYLSISSHLNEYMPLGLHCSNERLLISTSCPRTSIFQDEGCLLGARSTLGRAPIKSFTYDGQMVRRSNFKPAFAWHSLQADKTSLPSSKELPSSFQGFVVPCPRQLGRWFDVGVVWSSASQTCLKLSLLLGITRWYKVYWWTCTEPPQANLGFSDETLVFPFLVDDVYFRIGFNSKRPHLLFFCDQKECHKQR